jgi:hypothetical protein
MPSARVKKAAAYRINAPPIWPMILRGAMPDPFGGDAEAAATRCLDAIVHGNDVTIRLAIRGAIRILSKRCISVNAACHLCL